MSTLQPSPPSLEPLDHQDDEELIVSVVIPCLNEEANIERCVTTALAVMSEFGIPGEVVVADNASEDRSAELAAAAGARVIHEPRRGYGSAYLAGFAAARGRYIVMGDADLTYDFREIPKFVKHLDGGAELVMGDRMDQIHPGAMPWLHRYVGNPVLTGILNVFFRTGVSDAHCGMRALRRDVLPRLDLRTTGMEFASEMVIRASKEKLRIEEFPIEYHPRGGESKLSSFRDGWRHLRFLLVHSPTYLFMLPGAIMLFLGTLVSLVALLQIDVFGREWDLHTMVAGALLMIVGVQIVALGLCAHAYGTYFMNEKDPWFDRMRARFRLEHGLVLGGLVAFLGFVVMGAIVIIWVQRGFGQLSEERLAVLAASLVIVGLQIFFTSFLLSILGLRRSK
ncbi:glycosyltransferase family 2 protein [Solirubrobacter soli]|uniref:glycosyltransferase family 2 protein n=1 Tax=Solirubrobacter soli TaxID=363832 RepID=UPI00040C7B34|nr:glycosyltransferase family 2 protein [Solirubrobacter soli]